MTYLAQAFFVTPPGGLVAAGVVVAAMVCVAGTAAVVKRRLFGRQTHGEALAKVDEVQP